MFFTDDNQQFPQIRLQPQVQKPHDPNLQYQYSQQQNQQQQQQQQLGVIIIIISNVIISLLKFLKYNLNNLLNK